MTGRITGMVQYGKSLAVLTESSIIVTHDNGKEPNEWPKEVFSDVGTNDEFVRQFADEFIELMGATSIFDPERQDVKDALMVLLIEGLLPAPDGREPNVRAVWFVAKNAETATLATAYPLDI